MGQLTTHVLDLAQGRPAADVEIDIYEQSGDSIKFLRNGSTNKDGRLDEPLLETLNTGTYELHFHIGEYFRHQDVPRVPFLDIVVVRFVITDVRENYHVPLLVSPGGYQVYRGS